MWVSVGKLKSMPKFPAVKVTSKPRGSYNLQEYLALVRVARQLKGVAVPEAFTGKSRRGQGTLEKFARVSADFHWLIRFMVNGFMRPSDIKCPTTTPTRRAAQCFPERIGCRGVASRLGRARELAKSTVRVFNVQLGHVGRIS